MKDIINSKNAVIIFIVLSVVLLIGIVFLPKSSQLPEPVTTVPAGAHITQTSHHIPVAKVPSGWMVTVYEDK